MQRRLALGYLGSLLWSAARGAGAEPVLRPEPLRILENAFRRPLPGRFQVRSKLTWPTGTLVQVSRYHGDARRWSVQSSSFSIRTYQNRSLTMHSRTTAVYGGNWLSGWEGAAAKEAPAGAAEAERDQDGLVITRLQHQFDGQERTPAQCSVRGSRGPLQAVSHLGAGAIAFGHLPPTGGLSAVPLWRTLPGEKIVEWPETETSGETETAVIQFQSDRTRRTLSLDPGQEMLPRQIEMEFLRPTGSATPTPPATVLFTGAVPTARRARYHAFRIELPGAVPRITSFRGEFDVQGSGKEIVPFTGEYTIEEIEADAPPPSDEELTAAIDLPEGESVRVTFGPTGMTSGRWREGRFEKGAPARVHFTTDVF